MLARQAGLPAVSGLGVAAGTLAALGAVAVVGALAAALVQAVGLDTGSLSDSEWETLGLVSAVVGALVLLGAFFFGGYVAGRMARRAGASNGALVAIAGVVVLGVTALVGEGLGTVDAVSDRLEELGVPTGDDVWAVIGIVAGLASLAAVVVGALLGGVRGEGWHGRLLRRALDPDVGPEAAARQAAARAHEEEAEHARRRTALESGVGGTSAALGGAHAAGPAPSAADRDAPERAGPRDDDREGPPPAADTSAARPDEPEADPARTQHRV